MLERRRGGPSPRNPSPIHSPVHIKAHGLSSFPRTVYFLLVSTVEKLLFNWKNVRVTVHFKESRAVYESLLAHQVRSVVCVCVCVCVCGCVCVCVCVCVW